MALGQFYGIATPGNNGVECRVYVSITDDAANNRSRVDAELQFRKTNGFASQGNAFGSFKINNVGINITGNKTLPANGTWVTFGVAGARYYSHAANGQLSGTVTVAVNGVGISGSSDFDTPVSGSLNFSNGNGFTNYTRLPGAPGLPVVSNLEATSCKFSWAAASSPVAITDYGQYLAKNADFTVMHTPATWIGTAREFTYSNLSRGTEYWFRTRARSSEGTGPYTTAVKITTPHTVPDKPPTPSVGSITSTSAQVNTTDPAYVGAGVTGRETQVREGTTVVATSTSADPTFNSLLRSKNYTVRYRVRNAVGWSEWSNNKAFQTPGTPPSAPAGYTVTEIAATTVKVTTGTIADNGGAVPSQIRVKVSTTASDMGLVDTITQEQWAPIVIPGLSENTNYYVAEAAFNTAIGGGWGEYGPWVPFSTINTVPTPPQNLDVDDITETTATATWVAPDDLNGSVISYYVLLVADDPALTQNLRTINVGSGTSQVIDNLTGAKSYYVRVYSMTNNGRGSISGLVSFTTEGGGGSSSGIYIDVGGTPKFAEVWIDIEGVPKLCEVWIDVAGTPKLCVP